MIAPLALLACERAERGQRPEGTVVIASVAEPATLLPPLIFDAASRDIADLIFERLAELAPGGASVDMAAFRPMLAERWERTDSLTWRFHLRRGARWHDGVPVRADDVVFSFSIYADSAVDALARPIIADNITATAEDSSTVLLRFRDASAEQLYDATQHVRILPRHIWEPAGPAALLTDTTLAHLVGSGPYRIGRRSPDAIFLSADTLRPQDQRAGIATVVVRVAGDPAAAVNLLLSHEADLMESLITEVNAERVAADSLFRVERYPSAVYGFLAFRVNDAAGRPHPVLGSRATRRALAMAVDREALATSVFGPATAVPVGPMSQLSWVGTRGIGTIARDTAAASSQLRGHGVAFDILVPSTSPARVQMAEALQEMWRRIGVSVTVTRTDFPVFQERLARGRFDSYIGAYLDEPTMRGLAEQWGGAGGDQLNYGRWSLPAFDSLLARAGALQDTALAGPLFRQAISLLNEDAPAIFLYNPMNAAAVSRRVIGVTINPYSWLASLPSWRVASPVSGRLAP